MAESFNIERFMEGSGKVDLSDIDWESVPSYRLTPEALRTIRYFLITESSTFFYTKALMQTRSAVREPELAPFISVWLYEEEFHGRAFRRFLQAYGEPISEDYRKNLFRERTAGERIDELSQTVLSRMFHEWTVVHMIWGTVQELTTYTAYQALIERAQHPVLTTICQRVMKQELRHYAFYREHAKRRLESSEWARQLATWALKLGWTPVGEGMSAREESCNAIRFLFDGHEGPAIEKIERKIRELPGLGWFDMFTRYAVEHDLRKAPASWMPKRAAGHVSAPVAALTAD